MLDEIRRIAQGVVDHNTFLMLYTAQVCSLEPLRVRVDSLGIDLGGSQLIVANYLSKMNMLDEIRSGTSVILLGPIKGNQYYMMDVSV